MTSAAVEKVSCLGPEGSYSELAAKKLCAGAQIMLCRSFPEVISALLSGAADSAVVPIENSIQGGVLQNLDLLYSENVFAVETYSLPIDHRLAVKEGTPLSKIERVCSHQQAIGQCSEYLQTRLPQAKIVYTQSTAESLSKIDGVTAGIVGAHVHQEGVVLSEYNIANEKRNFTTFFRLVRRGEEDIGHAAHGEKVFFCAVLEHRPGSLLALLQVFAEAGINLTKIESRPIRDVPGEYRFFIEISGDAAKPQVRRALERARESCSQCKILGVY